MYHRSRRTEAVEIPIKTIDLRNNRIELHQKLMQEFLDYVAKTDVAKVIFDSFAPKVSKERLSNQNRIS